MTLTDHKTQNKIGIDLGGSKIAVIAMSHRDQVLFENRVPTPKGNYQSVVAAICKLVGDARAVCEDEPTIGIGIPGSCEPKSGLIQNANSTWMNGRDFFKDISQALGQNVKLANDANCLALSESFDGAAIGAKTVFAAILGTGCGGGLVIEQKLLTGRHNIAGEWGHTPLPWPEKNEFPAPICWCGRKGCLETWISGSGMERDFNASFNQKINAETIVERAASGDQNCQETLNRHCDRLARGLAMITNFFDPDVIVLGGGLSNLDHLYEQLPERMSPFVFTKQFEAKIVRPVHGDASGVRGAARLWVQGK